MPEKYHIETKKVARRLPPVGKFGIVDWREDCARCHNCVKKACVYDRYRQEMDYIKDLKTVESMFFECMGCFSCVQSCTKGILALTVNPEYRAYGQQLFHPGHHRNHMEAGRYSGHPSLRRRLPRQVHRHRLRCDVDGHVGNRPPYPRRHSRPRVISTSIDIGRKPRLITFDDKGKLTTELSPLVDLPIPLIIDKLPEKYLFPALVPIFAETAKKTHTLLILDWEHYGLLGTEKEKYLPHLVFHLENNQPLPPDDILCKTRLVEIDDENVEARVRELKKINPALVVMVRIALDAHGEERSMS